MRRPPPERLAATAAALATYTWVLFEVAFVRSFSQLRAEFLVAFVPALLLGLGYDDLRAALLALVGSIFVSIVLALYLVGHPVAVFISPLSAKGIRVVVAKYVIGFSLIILTPCSIPLLAIGLYLRERLALGE